MKSILIYFSIKYKGYFHDIYNAIKRKESIDIKDLDNINKLINSKKIQAITIIDDDYPEPLKLINQPPFVLFYEGNKELLKEKIIMLTGDFSNENINKFIYESSLELSKNYTLISNFAKGLDEEIIEYLINNKKNLILISSNGLINPYFGKNINDLKLEKDKYLLMSEYPSNVNLNYKRLIQRNRISIGLSEALIIASSYKDSKISNLVSCALEQGKEIFCFPGLQNENDGNNLLIKDGATMITSIKNKI